MIGTFALGNLGRAVLIGIAPDRRSDLARFRLRAVPGVGLATMMTATSAGTLTGTACLRER
jgi:nucleoside permease NupC